MAPAPGPAVLTLVEDALQRVLELDAEGARRLKALDGRRIAIEFAGTTRTLHIHCTADGLRLSAAGPRPDVTIRGTPLQLAGQLLPGGGAARTELQITGDVELAQQFQNALRGIEPDWDELLAGWVGDSAAQRIGSALRGLHGMAREFRQDAARDTTEWLRYERALVPDRDAVGRFAADVDRLRDDAERLHARLQRLVAARPAGR
jgi:ubiquinone biosynthesis protein UbiJ